MTRRFTRFLRKNSIALVALFFALSGTTFAAANALGPNTVGTKQLKKGAVTSPKIRGNAVTGAKVKNDSLTGTDIVESSLGKVPSATSADTAAPAGAAGGSLAGTYPNPTLAPGSVTSTALGTITQRNATSASIAAGGNGSVTASCLAGEKFLSGGNDGFFDVFVVASRQSGNGWAVFGHNNAGVARTITAHVYCLAP